MNYSKEQKQEIFANLPADLREAILSVETAEKLQNIASKHSLMMDQVSELSDEIGLLMLGLTKQSSFVKNVSSRLGISSGKADEVARDVNEQIFDAIRESLRKFEEKDVEGSDAEGGVDISSIETAGQFTLEKPEPIASSIQYNETPLNKEAILKGIEGSEEPMVDHLLKAPLVTPQKTEVKTPESIAQTPAPKPPTEKPKAYTADPYREAL